MKPICDFSDERYDICEMWGDARTANGTNTSRVYFIPSPSQLAIAEAAAWSIRSQFRKIIAVREVTVRSLNLSNIHEAPSCTVRRWSSRSGARHTTCDMPSATCWSHSTPRSGHSAARSSSSPPTSRSGLSPSTAACSGRCRGMTSYNDTEVRYYPHLIVPKPSSPS